MDEVIKMDSSNDTIL